MLLQSSLFLNEKNFTNNTMAMQFLKILFQSFFPIIFNYENDRFLLFLLKTDSLIPRALQDFLQENKVKASDISHTFYDLKPFIENFPSMLDLYENDFDYSSSYLLKLG